MEPISVIIPAYNEQHIIKKTIANILQVLREANCEGEIVIVDDRSTDGTANKAAETPARLIRHP